MFVILAILILVGPVQAYVIPVLSGGYRYTSDIPAGVWVSSEFPVVRNTQFVLEFSNSWKAERYDQRFAEDSKVVQSVGLFGVRHYKEVKIIKPFLSLLVGASNTRWNYFTKRYGTEKEQWDENWRRWDLAPILQSGVGVDIRIDKGIYCRIAIDYRRVFDGGGIDKSRIAVGVVFLEP